MSIYRLAAAKDTWRLPALTGSPSIEELTPDFWGLFRVSRELVKRRSGLGYDRS